MIGWQDSRAPRPATEMTRRPGRPTPGRGARRSLVRAVAACAALAALLAGLSCGASAKWPKLPKVSELARLAGADSAKVDSAEAKLKMAQKFLDAFDTISPEQEYYVGRAVSAQILVRYPLRDRPAGRAYVNLVGATASLASARPDLYCGYRFAVLESEELNAFASPDGTIFITHGLLALCDNEDELAAVLAHEVAHVQARHGMKSLGKEEKIEAGRMIVTELGAGGSKDMAKLSGALNSTAAGISRTLLTKGYDRKQEEEADAIGLRILAAAGYDPGALPAVLEKLATQWNAGGPALMRSHKDPGERVRLCREALKKQPGPPRDPARDDRFRARAGEL